MNHSFTTGMAEALANRIEGEAGSPRDQITHAFELAFTRSPSEEELSDAQTFVESHGMKAFCRALLNTNEFIHVN